MNRIDEISKDNIERKYVIGIIVFMSLMWIGSFVIGYLNMEKLDLKVLYLPILVIVTLVIHEYIHIVLFKVFGKGSADIEIKRDKKLGAIVVHQKNKEVLYNKKETIIILLMPAILITVASLIKISLFPSWEMILKVNMLLNIIGSSIDIVTSYKLLQHKDDIMINYDFIEGKGMRMNIYK